MFKYAFLFICAGLLLFAAGAGIEAGLPDAAVMLLLVVLALLPLAAWLNGDSLRKAFASRPTWTWMPLRHCAVKVPSRHR